MKQVSYQVIQPFYMSMILSSLLTSLYLIFNHYRLLYKTSHNFTQWHNHLNCFNYIISGNSQLTAELKSLRRSCANKSGTSSAGGLSRPKQGILTNKEEAAEFNVISLSHHRVIVSYSIIALRFQPIRSRSSRWLYLNNHLLKMNNHLPLQFTPHISVS